MTPRRSGPDWPALAAAVRAQRTLALDITQEEAARRAGFSIVTWRKIEAAAATGYDVRTLRSVERALVWPAGTVNAVLAGGEPPAVVEWDGDGAPPEHVDTLKAYLDGRLADMEARLLAEMRKKA